MRVSGSTTLRNVAGTMIGRAVSFVDVGASPSESPSAVVPSEIEALVYELLDAHADTADLAAELEGSGDQTWSIHIDYLRGLQRTGRQALAHFGAERVA